MTSKSSYCNEPTSSMNFVSHVPEAPAHLFRVGSDTSLSSLDTISRSVDLSNDDKNDRDSKVKTGTTTWDDNVWVGHSSPVPTTSKSPPPYTKSTTTATSYETKLKQPRVPTPIAKLCSQAQLSTAEGPGPSAHLKPLDQYNEDFLLLKNELETYPHKNLILYSIRKTQAFDAAVNKVTRLEKHIRDVEKLDRGPRRRQRRGLMVLLVVLTVMVVMGWSLAGVWKAQGDQARGEIEKIREKGEMLGVGATASSDEKTISISSLDVSVRSTTDLVDVQPTNGLDVESKVLSTQLLPTRTTTRRDGGQEGQNQRLPFHCVDRGGGVVGCSVTV